jgi:hypothetical protein
MEIQSVEFDVIEFEGADGKIHTIRQCSLAHREELKSRFDQLSRAVKDAPIGWTIGNLYDRDRQFKYWCDRALKLCGIKPKWVGVAHLTALLFVRKDEDGNPQRGWLIDLNFPRPAKNALKGDPQSYAQVVAALSTYVESMEKAIALAKEHPHGELMSIVRAKSELMEKQRRKTDKSYAQECEKRESQAKAQDALKAIQEQLYGGNYGGG